LINPTAAFCFWLFASCIALVFFWKRWRWRRNKARGKRHLGFYPNAATLGNALQILQALSEPHTEQILEQKLAEPAEDEDSGGPDDPTAHLHRQAQQIREGTPPERITALLPRASRKNPL
jgi:hypothetical protein